MATTAVDDHSDDLAEFGYKQELHRSIGRFASFAAGVSYISILTGTWFESPSDAVPATSPAETS